MAYIQVLPGMRRSPWNQRKKVVRMKRVGGNGANKDNFQLKFSSAFEKSPAIAEYVSVKIDLDGFSMSIEPTHSKDIAAFKLSRNKGAGPFSLSVGFLNRFFVLSDNLDTMELPFIEQGRAIFIDLNDAVVDQVKDVA